MINSILVSEVTLPDHHPRGGARCPVFGCVIHNTLGPVLVDTGVGVGDPVIERLFSPMHHPLEAALADVGVTVGDVRMVVNSHLHFDHCGNNRLFPGVPLVVQRTEHEAAQAPGHTVAEWIDFPGQSGCSSMAPKSSFRVSRSSPPQGTPPGINRSW